MKFERFEDITFKDSKDFSFRDQIQRATISIMNNIAEGLERGSNKDFSKFLYIAKGSCGEVRSMLDLALKLEYLDQDKQKELIEEAISISKLLAGLIRSISEYSTFNI